MELSHKCFELRCQTKNYAWGKVGTKSMVAQLQKARNSDFFIKEDVPYAELWMGTHPSGPSVIPSMKNILLSEWIEKNPHNLGEKIKNKFGINLPYLFKVLSINQPLSIQVHPDKQKAEKLHKFSSELYPDDNHKPEMAIALTKFEALCGFRPISEIQEFFKESPQLQLIIGESLVKKFLSLSETDINCSEILKNCFEALMKTPEIFYKQNLKDVVAMLQSDHVPQSFKPICQLFLEVHSKYPGDIGCFCLLFLNYLILEPGEAIYLSANEPHAYISGDCIECMACSDNVVRAGLTPKHKDVETLCSILTYQCRTSAENLFKPKKQLDDPYVLVYDPPIEEFTVAKIEIPNGKNYKLELLDSSSILLVIEGEINVNIPNDRNHIKLTSGSIFFISCGIDLNMEVTSKALMFRAYCYL